MTVTAADDEEMERGSLSLVHYDIQAGFTKLIPILILCIFFMAHFQSSFGEFCEFAGHAASFITSSLYSRQPVLSPEWDYGDEWRVTNTLAHAKPWEYLPEQFTLVFKLPELNKKVTT